MLLTKKFGRKVFVGITEYIEGEYQDFNLVWREAMKALGKRKKEFHTHNKGKIMTIEVSVIDAMVQVGDRGPKGNNVVSIVIDKSLTVFATLAASIMQMWRGKDGKNIVEFDKKGPNFLKVAGEVPSLHVETMVKLLETQYDELTRLTNNVGLVPIVLCVQGDKIPNKSGKEWYNLEFLASCQTCGKKHQHMKEGAELGSGDRYIVTNTFCPGYPNGYLLREVKRPDPEKYIIQENEKAQKRRMDIPGEKAAQATRKATKAESKKN